MPKLNAATKDSPADHNWHNNTLMPAVNELYDFNTNYSGSRYTFQSTPAGGVDPFVFVLSGTHDILQGNYGQWLITHFSLNATPAYNGIYGLYLLVRLGSALTLIPISQGNQNQARVIVDGNGNIQVENVDKSVWKRHSVTIQKLGVQ